MNRPAITFALLLAVVAYARADPIIFPCGSVAQFEAGARARSEVYVTLSPEQFQFARGMFAISPDTPASLPPGDHAVMSTKDDGSASLVFIDGDLACAPLKLAKIGVMFLKQVGRGEIVHSGQGL